MPYLRRLLLLLTLSTSILLVTVHLLHFTRPRHQEPLHPVITQEEAERNFDYLKQYDHPTQKEDLSIPSPEYAAKIAFGKDPARPPTKGDVYVPEQELKDQKQSTQQKDQKPQKDQKEPTEQKTPNDSKPESSEQKETKPEPKPMPKLKPKPDTSKVAPANATAWHKDKNLWKVADALQA